MDWNFINISPQHTHRRKSLGRRGFGTGYDFEGDESHSKETLRPITKAYLYRIALNTWKEKQKRLGCMLSH